MKRLHNPEVGSFLSTNRIEAFSDGVFAVAITLLVLNLQVPQIAASLVSKDLPQKLLDLGPKLLIFALSFIVVGIYWVAHHNTFHYIKHADRNLLWLNILLLLCIVFIPFPTELLGQYPDQQISVHHLWWHTSSHRARASDIMVVCHERVSSGGQRD